MLRMTHLMSWRFTHALIVFSFVALFSASTVAQQRPSKRRTALVSAIASTRASVVNIRGRKSIQQGNTFTVSSSQPRQVNGMGTGVVIDSRGYILTNYHVVQGVKQIKITTSRNETMIA